MAQLSYIFYAFIIFLCVFFVPTKSSK
ncbi:Nodule Cysteine-Rich (NCR) secreted peptide [Medicago truncatula]|uniref:Nodule Cysteine-Rich (NCR) secreted peptide n=1 Tax=Medicago truncatula TaxID=3880 RepID=A0A072VA98_MEDTR|nr:Nodule Cysteine-Rich (NCR) secreted peptide [Medicago truncatula]